MRTSVAPAAIRALHGRHEAAGRDHQDGQQQCTEGTGRSGLDLSTFRRCGNHTPAPPAAAAAASARDCLESAEPVVRPLSTSHCEGEAQYRGDHRDRPRDRSLPVGDCTRGRARVGHTTEDVAAALLTPWISKGINANKEDNRCARLGTGPRWGTPQRRLEASHVPMPVVRQGPAPDGNRKCGIQPAHQSRSTDVQRSRLLPCTATSNTGSRTQGVRKENATHPLNADIRAAVCSSSRI